MLRIMSAKRGFCQKLHCAIPHRLGEYRIRLLHETEQFAALLLGLPSLETWSSLLGRSSLTGRATCSARGAKPPRSYAPSDSTISEPAEDGVGPKKAIASFSLLPPPSPDLPPRITTTYPILRQ